MEHATPRHTTRQVSVSEAARELGVSTETVRRRIKSGDLQAERSIRPQGAVWLVTLPDSTPRGVPPVTGHSTPQDASLVASDQEKARHTSQATEPVALQATRDATTLQAGHDATMTGLVASVARLIAELAEVRVISDRRADALVEQARTLGDLREQLATAQARITVLEGARPPVVEVSGRDVAGLSEQLTPRSSGQEPRWWSRLGRWLTLGLVAVALTSASCSTPDKVTRDGVVCRLARADFERWKTGAIQLTWPSGPGTGYWTNVLEIIDRTC